jgi:hypothetical protein
MKEWVAIAVTTLAATATALLSSPARAVADPAVPAPGAPCSSNLADAMTRLPDEKTYLMCLNQPDLGYQWKTVAPDYPISDRWLTYGPELKLHGEGIRNSSIRSGDWIAFPQDSASQCRAEKAAVVSAGVVGSPQFGEGTTGQPLSLRVLPNLFSITMTGYFLWEKVGS